MPQGLLQVNHFVTTQNLMRTVSAAINRAKYNRCKALPVTLTRSRFCGASFKIAQWFQYFIHIPGGRGTRLPVPLADRGYDA